MKNKNNIPEKIVIFFDAIFVKHHSKKRIAKVVNCHINSISPAFSSLRRKGYIVHAYWDWKNKQYMYSLE